MKTLNILLAILFLTTSSAFGAEFVDGMDDIPLPEGMAQIHSANISFGNDESRFNEAYISSKKISFAKVADFYKDTLPQLGWKFVGKKENSLHFERDMEVLDIAMEKNNPLLVRMTLKSKD
ncbi:MAG: hypothetical protein Q4D11_04275 [Rhodospirillales bacterium]|nr:hypothetical protein [Rhodospirillales bacterium]